MSGGVHHVHNTLMSRVFNLGSLLGSGGGGGGSTTPSPRSEKHFCDSIIKKGYLKKYKSTNNRYFVLFKQSGSGSPARLECYENEQKFLEDYPPKRKYLLNQSIEIMQKYDSKKPHSVVLTIKQDTCCVTASSQQELEEWLTALYSAAKSSNWQQCWDVEVLNKGLAGGRWTSLVGERQLNLTKSQLSITKCDGVSDCVDIPLNVIEKVECNQEFFFLEIGKLANTGSGKIWIKAVDTNIAESMVTIINKTMLDNSSSPRDRTSSMSITEGGSDCYRERSGSLPARPVSIGDHHHLLGTYRHQHCPPELVDDGRGGFMLGNMDITPHIETRHLPTHFEGDSFNESFAESVASSISELQQPYLDMSRKGNAIIMSPPNPHLKSPSHTTPFLESPCAYSENDYVNAMPTPSSRAYLEMNIATSPSQPKPIPGNLDADISPASACSSLTSGVSTPCSNHRPPSLSQDICGGRVLNTIDTDSVHEDSSIEDALDDRARSCIDDDIDMDMECDQVDSGIGRGCLEPHSYLATDHMEPSNDDDDDRPIRTSSLGSKPDISKRKNSAPMLGITCPSTSWSDNTGSYIKNWFNSRVTQDKHKPHMLMDFSKNSYDHISSSHLDESKDKKSLSFERIKHTFSRHRASTKSKKRVSEGDACNNSYRGRAIEIPSVNSDYYPVDLNPSPRSNNSTTSTSSDVVPIVGYLNMKPGPSLSFSSTCSSEYVVMSSDAIASGSFSDDGYIQMSPRTFVEPGLYMDVTDNNNAYVDMTQGSCNSQDSSCSYSLRLQPPSTLARVSSIELPSPQEEAPEFYLHEIDRAPKDKKKFRRKSVKESIKRKKSDPNAGECIGGSSRGKSSSHFSSISSLLTRKHSQNSSSHKTPLSPTGSPLPKSSRNSSSPFASLGRSKSKEGREGSSVSPTSASSSILTRNFRDSTAMENENYCSMDSLEIRSIPRNLSNRELISDQCDVDKSHHVKRSSGSFEMSSSAILAAVTENERMSSEALCLCHPPPDRGEDVCGTYVNFPRLPDSINISSNSSSANNNAANGTSRKVISGVCSHASLKQSFRLSSTSYGQMMDTNPSTCCPSNNLASLSREIKASGTKSQDSSEYVDMRPPIKVTDKSTLSSTVSILPQMDRKILNTEPQSSNSDYLQMNVSPVVTSTAPTIVKKPDLPPIVLNSRPEPSVPLERLTIAEMSSTEGQLVAKSSCSCSNCSTATCSSSERCRSHSGPGAPEGSSLCSSSVSVVMTDSMKDGDVKAHSASSSPVSYSPPTSPHLASSSKSSLSEGGLSSASSTCTVVNVGLRLQQHRKSHASGSSQSADNTHTTSSLNPITSTIVGSEAGVPVENTKLDSAKGTPCSDSETKLDKEAQKSVEKVDIPSKSKDKSSPEYACLDFLPNDGGGEDAAHKNPASNSPKSSRKRNPSGGVSVSCQPDQEGASSTYTEIDFNRSESLRNVRLMRDALRN